MSDDDSSSTRRRRERRRLYEEPAVASESGAAAEPVPVPAEPTAPIVAGVPSRGPSDAIIWRSVLKSSAVGALPLPFFGTFGVSAVELQMVRELADHHGAPLDEAAARAAVGSLLAGTLVDVVGHSLAGQFLRIFPPFGLLFMPLFSGAATYAVGRTLDRHFAQGGTLADFDAERARKGFGELVQDGLTALRKQGNVRTS